MEKYLPFVRLSDNETWAEMRHTTLKDTDFESAEACHEWIKKVFPDYIRPDIFHGLQPIVVTRVR